MQEIEAKDCDKFVQEIIEQEKDLASQEAMNTLKKLRLKINDLLPRDNKVDIAIYVDIRSYEAKIKGKGEEVRLKININADGTMNDRKDKSTDLVETSSQSLLWKITSPIVSVVKFGFYTITSLFEWLLKIATVVFNVMSTITNGICLLIKLADKWVNISNWYTENRENLPYCLTG